MREAKLVCPSCGTSFSVYEDEIGESGGCPSCGAAIEVGGDLFGEDEAIADDEGLLELLAEDAEGLAVPDVTSEDEEEAAEPEPTGQKAQPAGLRPGPALRKAGGAVEPPVGELDYRLWQGLAEQSGDWAMVVRLDAWRRAQQAGCEMFTELPDGSTMPIPQMILAEAGVACFQSQSEQEWREEWTRRLLQVAAKGSDEATTEAVVALLTHTGSVIAGLKSKGAWPWNQQEEQGS